LNRKTISNIIFLLAVNVLVKPFWLFGIDRVVQNKLGEETFGIYFALFNFSMIYQIFLDFGIQQYNSKNIAENPHQVSQHIPNLIMAKLGLSTLYLILLGITFLLLGYSASDYGGLFALLALNQILISFIAYFRSNLAGLQKFKLDALFSVLDKILMILIAGSMLYYNVFNIQLSIFSFVAIQTLAFFINLLVLSGVIKRMVQPLQWQMDVRLIKSLLIKSTPYATTVFLMAIYLKMDVIMIERMLGEEGAYEAGVYAQSFRIIDALNMIGILFANILLPTYAQRLGQNLPLKRLIGQALLLLLLIILPISTMVILKSKWLIHLMYENGSDYSAEILVILIISFIAYSMMHIFSSLLTAAGHLKTLNKIFFIGIVVNLCSNFWLIPKMGAKGAAITTACSEVLVLLAIIFLVWRFLGKKKANQKIIFRKH
jgi:O-antigen/teichoic acid export membrane protein